MASADHVVVIGAGIGGLVAALRLSAAGCDVTVVDRASGPGGKMRTQPSAAGPVDAGPTVLTMRHVFDEIFAHAGFDLDQTVRLTPLPVLARHYWADGTQLDLYPGRDRNADAIADVFGAKAGQEFSRFAARAARLFAAFDKPMMQSARPQTMTLALRVLRHPELLRDMAVFRSLKGMLAGSFSEPRLAQLFGRYATYVGGMPGHAPALLSLIWEAEAQGVWSVDGGMYQLALALESAAKARGVTFHYDSMVDEILSDAAGVCGVKADRRTWTTRKVVFNGDPRALMKGALGPMVKQAVRGAAVEPRSLSACVLTFAARPNGPALSHHTVFFGDDPDEEFSQIARGCLPLDPTLYLCAQDHATAGPSDLQRFEIIMNAPPLRDTEIPDYRQCQTHILNRCRRFGLTFDPEPGVASLTDPVMFDRLFPQSLGSLYGRSPHGLTAAMKRPTARTAIRGLYLCGGGAHPGAGVPMAALSGRHAAETILQDLGLTSPSRRMAMHGGTSMGGAHAARGPSPS